MKHILQKLISYETLNFNEARDILYKISTENLNDSEISSFITVFCLRPITIEELGGFRNALLDLCIRVNLDDFNTIDLCGTGGDGKNTFNISTLSSIIVAGTGRKVAKHGNYGLSSACGSSNVIESLGYKFTNNADTLRKQLEKTNICFMHAPLFHPALKNVAHIRKELAIKTFFNILGPLVNPSCPKNRLSGVFNLETARLYSYLYQKENINYTILHSLDGYDEISLTGKTKVFSNKGESLFEGRDLNLNNVTADSITGGNNIKEAAEIFTNILENKGSLEQTNVVLTNAAHAIKCMDQTLELAECYDQAKYSLESGNAFNVLNNITTYN